MKHLPSKDGEESQDHFMTLSFSKGHHHNTVKVTVRAWLIREKKSGLQRAWTHSFILNEGKLSPDGIVLKRVVKKIVRNDDGEILAFVNQAEPSWSPRYRHEIERDLHEGLVSYINEKNQQKITYDIDKNSLNNIADLPIVILSNSVLRYHRIAPSAKIYGAYDIYALARYFNKGVDVIPEQLKESIKPVLWLEPILNVMMN